MLETRNVPSHLLALILNMSKESLRNFSSMYHYGERKGKELHYSDAECRQLALAEGLAKAGLGWRAAFDLVANPTPAIAAALAGQGGALRFSPQRAAGGSLACTINVVVDGAAIVRAALARLEVERQADQARGGLGRRTVFELSTVPADRA